MNTPLPTVPHICAICGSRDLETCKVTYDGKTVHDDCIVELLIAKTSA